MTRPRESSLVFNIVWTGTVFTYLRYFAESQLATTEARFRFVANGCPPAQLELMHEFRARHPEQVVEVLDISPDLMIAHGVALDRVRDLRDDGDHFCLIDPDIKANGPWVGEFIDLLADHDAVTSGREVWSDSNVVPEGYPGVPGEFFFDQQGFVFGSPHLALYRREALDATTRRWGVGLGSAGPELGDDAKAAMAAMGHAYMVYDTAKIVNALLQADGHPLVHRDLPQLVHIGGLAHYLSPPAYRTTEEGETEPDWTRFEIMKARHEVTRYTARTLQALVDGDPAPPVPTGLEPSMDERLQLVRREVTDLMARYGPARPDPPAAAPADPPKPSAFAMVYGKLRRDLTDFFWDAFVALNVNGISGDYVEFGSAGATTIRLAHDVVSATPVDRHLWAFDSFAGLPEPTSALDDHPAFAAGVGLGGLDAFLAQCDEHGMARSSFTAIEGFFEDSFATIGAGPPDDIALAYVDCNMYSSTVSVLEFLAPRLKHGMIVAFDDYYCWTAHDASGERVALDEFLTRHPEWHFLRFKDPTWGGTSFVVERVADDAPRRRP